MPVADIMSELSENNLIVENVCTIGA